MGDVFKALADPTRRVILDELQERSGQTLFELCGRLFARHGLTSSRQAVSQHLDVLEAAGLVETLKGEGPFTVFAPTDAAFAKLPAGTVDTLLKDPKGDLTQILTYHVVPGVYTAKDLMKLAKDGGGEAQLKTVQGEPLVVQSKGKKVYVTDAKGSTATVTTANVMQSNGVIHVINGVLQP